MCEGLYIFFGKRGQGLLKQNIWDRQLIRTGFKGHK